MDNGQDTPREKGLSEDDLHDKSPGFFYSICISLLSFVVVFLLFCACFAFSGDSYHESPPEGKSDSTREKLLKSNVCFFGWNFLRNG